ncbi:hypothetical protein PACILC2_22340 [Paenibacillus cisolokensis]|uniref:DUF3892 domain-containing protein n=1 Tax=Paenibacillus cisolokensis TaxID=1658519 RepID=A0ABQ4N690_9BACL|nr:hypothetical protein [Paenibacillus cisolokensis]GIQ63666.1 hypothetical protein PACILC2_22340 [Paenibacillus cisolokensis]
MNTYIIESIRDIDGGPHERDERRRGQRVQIVTLTVGERFIAYYVDEGTYLRTSLVRSVLTGDNVLKVRTENSVYTLRKEAIE